MATITATKATTTAPTKLPTSWQRFASVFREAHPIGREPRYLKSHSLPGAAYYFRRLGRASSMFVPVMVTFFGWPFLMKGLINASNGVKAPQQAKKAAKSAKMSRKSSIDGEAWRMKMPAV